MDGWGRVKDIKQYCHVCERTVRTWMTMGLPYSKVGGCTLIAYRDVDDFLRRHRQQNDADRIVDEIIRDLDHIIARRRPRKTTKP